MKLYESRRAPNPRRVRIFMAEKGIDLSQIERIEVDIAKGENLSPDYRQMNPMGGVPVLELDDGQFLSESVAICRYFEVLHPEPPLMGRSAEQQAIIEMWNRRMELNLLMPVAMAFRHGSGYFADREVVCADYGAASLNNASRMFGFLDRHLANNEYIAGDDFTIADITALVSIDFARVIKLGIAEEQSHLARWHAVVSARASARA
jgi:glutathione S-transferase